MYLDVSGYSVVASVEASITEEWVMCVGVG